MSRLPPMKICKMKYTICADRFETSITGHQPWRSRHQLSQFRRITNRPPVTRSKHLSLSGIAPLHGGEAAGPSNIAVWQPAAHPAAVIPSKRGFDQMAVPDMPTRTVSTGRMETSRASKVLPSVGIGGHTTGLQ